MKRMKNERKRKRKKKKKKRKSEPEKSTREKEGGPPAAGLAIEVLLISEECSPSGWGRKIQQHPEMLLCESLDLVFALQLTIPSMVDSQRAKNNHLIIVSPEWNQP